MLVYLNMLMRVAYKITLQLKKLCRWSVGATPTELRCSHHLPGTAFFVGRLFLKGCQSQSVSTASPTREDEKLSSLKSKEGLAACLNTSGIVLGCSSTSIVEARPLGSFLYC